MPSFEKENKLFCLFLLGMLALSFTGGNMAGERPSHGRLPTLDKFTQGSGKSPPYLGVSCVILELSVLQADRRWNDDSIAPLRQDEI